LVSWLESPVLADDAVRAELQRWVAEYRTAGPNGAAHAAPTRRAVAG
jgi:hypothetical protein